MAQRKAAAKTRSEKPADPKTLRIIGGQFGGRKLAYHGDPLTRPMKERVREAIFNLVGPEIKDMHAIDLFAGTGALGLEAMSRGAASATFVERHFPTADIVQQNIDQLGVESQCEVFAANTFIWIRSAAPLPPLRWLVLCSPPYDFYVERCDEMLTLIRHFMDHSPVGSCLVVESDPRFDTELLPEPSSWDLREYRPAMVSLYRKPAG